MAWGDSDAVFVRRLASSRVAFGNAESSWLIAAVYRLNGYTAAAAIESKAAARTSKQ